jgi:predicted TIM-barrel fold metal-dependent hydrolase
MPVINGRYWAIQDLLMEWPAPSLKHWLDTVFPPGSVDLTAPAARLEYMDEVGVDVQVLYPTFWNVASVTSPLREAALSRSYNRWLAQATSDSGGRLAWAVHVPLRTMDRALQELDFGKEHGAVSVYMHGQNHGMTMDDPYLLPLFEKAQDLELAIGIHTGSEGRLLHRERGAILHASIMPVAAALYAVLSGALHKKLPRLRWAFLEAGATWIPFVLQEIFRGTEGALPRSFKGQSFNDWRAAGVDAFAEHGLFVAAQMDDDLPYLLSFTGTDHLVYGTDYGHLDVGSDPNGLHVVANRTDVDPIAARKIVDDNGRRLYGIDPAFQPAPAPATQGFVLAPGAAMPSYRWR